MTGLEGYHDVHSYPEARHLPGLVIYRFDGPLFFAIDVVALWGLCAHGSRENLTA